MTWVVSPFRILLLSMLVLINKMGIIFYPLVLDFRNLLHSYPKKKKKNNKNKKNTNFRIKVAIDTQFLNCDLVIQIHNHWISLKKRCLVHYF